MRVPDGKAAGTAVADDERSKLKERRTRSAVLADEVFPRYA